MAFPERIEIQLELLRLLAQSGSLRLPAIYDKLAVHFGLTEEERSLRVPSDTEPKWNNEVRQAVRIPKRKGLIEGDGIWGLTDQGRQLVNSEEDVIRQQLVQQANQDTTSDEGNDQSSARIGIILDILERVQSAGPTSLTDVRNCRIAAAKSVAGERGVQVPSINHKFYNELEYENMENADEAIAAWLLEGSEGLRQRLEKFVSRRASEADREAIRNFFSGAYTRAESWWWVNQNDLYQEQRNGGYLCLYNASKLRASDQRLLHLKRMRIGDRVFHCCDNEIRSISIVQETGAWADESALGGDGFFVPVSYYDLVEPVNKNDIPLQLRTRERGPFSKAGTDTQTFISRLSDRFVSEISRLFRDAMPQAIEFPLITPSIWMFQFNPRKNYTTLAEVLANANAGDEANWNVTRYQGDMNAGDIVLLWQSGQDGGIVAVARLAGKPVASTIRDFHSKESAELVDGATVKFQYSRILNKPVSRLTVQHTPGLESLAILRQPFAGTNFRVTDAEWEILKGLIDEDQELEEGQQEEVSEPGLDLIAQRIRAKGLRLSDRLIRRYHGSLRSRGFVILAGNSGSGKTWLTQAYAEAIGAAYKLVPVAPNWTSNEDLLGYLNPLHGGKYHDTIFSAFLREASDELRLAERQNRKPRHFHVVLDEMNLARVEYYFAKFLSEMEVRSRDGVARVELAPGDHVLLGSNLFFVGTVNIDETTHGFADKVYDRAQVIELGAHRDDIVAHIGDGEYADDLVSVWDAVNSVKPFSFRVIDEIKSYIHLQQQLECDWTDALDEQILQKILPKLSGTDHKIEKGLESILAITKGRFPLSCEKAQVMLSDFRNHGFTSFF